MGLKMKIFASLNHKSDIDPDFREQQRSLPVSVYKELNEWVTIKSIPKNNGESFYFMERKGVDSVAFILVDNNRPDCIGLLTQYRGSYGEFLLGAYTGSLDKPELDLSHIVLEEVKEEAGFSIPEEDIDQRIIFISKEITGSMTNERVNLYIVNVTGLEQEKLEPESVFEENCENVWVTPEEALSKAQDWKVKLILLTV